MSKSKSKATPFILVLLTTLGAAGYGVGPGGWFRGEVEEAIKGVAVQRGALRIAETVNGNLSAKESESLRNELEGRTTVIYLIDEGTYVEQGELVVELDTSNHQDELVTQRIDVQSAEAAYIKATEQLAIQEIQNVSDIAAANLAARFAVDDYEKYVDEDGEWSHELQKAEETIVLRKEALAEAKKRLKYTEDLYDEGFAQRTELESDQIALNRSVIELEQAEREKKLKLKYENKRKEAELKEDIATKERDMLKAEKQATAKLADYKAEKVSSKFKLDLEKEKLEKIVDQLDKGIIKAPIAGLVVYARERSRWGSGEPMAEGVEVRERQEIVTIPRAGGMIVEASLHETVLERVQVGQPCIIVVDALPGKRFLGQVKFVAVLPDSNSYFSNPNQRIYRAEVSITDPVLEMRPGMSCSVEIENANYGDVLYIPVQCVFLDAGRPIVFVRNGSNVDSRPVQVGLDNSTWVIIEEGLSEGEMVLLSPPADFNPTPAEIEDGRGERLTGGQPDASGAPTQGGGMPAAAQGGARPGGGKPGGEFAGRPSSGDSKSGERSGRGRPSGGGSERPSGRERPKHSTGGASGGNDKRSND